MGIFDFISKRSDEEAQAAAAAVTAAKEAELNKKVNQLLEIIRSEGISCGGYTSLDHDPTIMTACEKIIAENIPHGEIAVCSDDRTRILASYGEYG